MSMEAANAKTFLDVLHEALIQKSSAGHVKIVQLLLQNGASVLEKDEVTLEYHFSSVHHDKFNNSFRTISQKGYTALMRAAEGGFCDVVRVLMRHGADPSATDDVGRTALHLAAATGKTMRCLFFKGTVRINTVDKRGRSALFYAAENGHLRAVRELLCYGAHLHIRNEDNKSASEVIENEEIQQLLHPYSEPLTKQAEQQKLQFTRIPRFLRAGELYRSLNADDDGVLSVPADCFHICDRAVDLCEFSKLLRAMKFWMLDRIPDGIIEYCFCYPIADWRTVAKDTCDPHSTEYRDLCTVFSGGPRKDLARAIRINRVEIVEYLAVGAEGERSYNNSTVLAARLGKLESLRALHKLGVPWDGKTCAAAAAGGHLECLKYAREHGCYWDEETTVEAAINGHIECLRYAFDEGCMFHPSVCEKAVQGGNWDCVLLTCRFKRWVKSSLCATAASYGHLHILQQLHLRGVPWDSSAPARAAKRGHLTCLQYLHENGCPWDENTTDAAARAGKFATLRYAIENGCPFS